MNEINKLEFETEPDYAKIQNQITESLQMLGHTKSLTDDFFVFAAPKASNKSLTNGKESKLIADDLRDEAITNKKPKTANLTPRAKKRDAKQIQEENLLELSVNDADLVEEKQTEGI